MEKEYNARGEKMYKNAINQENAKIKKKDTASSTKGHGEVQKMTQEFTQKDTGLKVNFSPRVLLLLLYYIILYYIILYYIITSGEKSTRNPVSLNVSF